MLASGSRNDKSLTTNGSTNLLDTVPDSVLSQTHSASPPNPDHLPRHASEQNRRPRRVAATTAASPPHLIPSKSAPTLSSTVEETPISKMAQAQSFSGHLNQDGDTQPMDSQIYKQYTEIRARGMSYLESATSIEPHDQEKSQVDLVRTWEKEIGTQPKASLEIDDTEFINYSPAQSPRHDMRSQLSDVTPPRDIFAETPINAGVKRNIIGETVSSMNRSSVQKFPGSALREAFGNTNAVPTLALSQLFNNTQAETPRMNRLQSDAISDRPSPDFVNFRHSSPPIPISSPIKDKSNAPRATTEPRDTYVSMKESQEIRERLRRRPQEKIQPHTDGPFDSDDDLSTDIQRIRLRKLREKEDRKALENFPSVKAPAKSSKTNNSKHKRAAGNIINLGSVSPKLAGPNRIIKPREGDGGIAPSNEDTCEISEVPTSISRFVTSPASDNVQVPMTSSRSRVAKRRLKLASPPTSLGIGNDSSGSTVIIGGSTAGSKNSPKLAFSSQDTVRTQTEAIYDSQPQQTPEMDGKFQSEVMVPSSMPAISQNSASQLATTTNQYVQERNINNPDKISPLKEPSALDPDVALYNNKQIPSSPPITYSEHSDVGGESDVELFVDDHAETEGRNEDQDIEREDETDEEDYTELTYSIIHVQDKVLTHTQRRNSVTTPRLPLESLKSETFHISCGPVNAQTLAKPTASSSKGEIAQSEMEGSSIDTRRTRSSKESGTSTSDNNNSRMTEATCSGVFMTARSEQNVTPPPHGCANLDSAQSPPGGSLKRFREMSQRDETQHTTIPDFVPDIMTEQDKEHLSLIAGSSPRQPNKRRKVTTYSRCLQRGHANKIMETFISPPLEYTTTPNRSPPSSATQHQNSMVQHPTQNTNRSRSPLEAVTVNDQQPMTISSDDELATRPSPIKTRATLRRRNSMTSKADSQPRKPIKPSRQYGRSRNNKNLNSQHQIILSQNCEDASQKTNKDKESCIVAPARVLARYRGKEGNYWPATCLYREGSHYRIRYDDNSEAVVNLWDIRKLDLRIDDPVKVDLTGMRKDWTIMGLEDKEVDMEKHPYTDQKGFRTLVLRAKQRVSSSREAELESLKGTRVSISDIYVTKTMFSQFMDRGYTDTDVFDPLVEEPRTPVHARSPRAPSSRSRRQPIAGYSNAENTIRPASASRPLFDNMLFSITFSKANGGEKDFISAKIRHHGGEILEDGFSEIFNISNTAVIKSMTSSTQKSTVKVKGKAKAGINTVELSAQILDQSDPKFEMTSKARETGFAALISDKHCRKVKYLQALALGIPCLSSRWIKDCVAASALLPITRYLLPAGDSAVLDAVHSRILPLPLSSYDPRVATLAMIVEAREHMIKDASVLLVVGTGKLAPNDGAAYVFLSYALGAKLVVRVNDLNTARDVLHDPQSVFEWVYVDADSLDEAERVLFSTSHEPVTSTLKSGSSAMLGTKKKKRASRGDVKEEVTDVNSSAMLFNFHGSHINMSARLGEINGRKVRIAVEEYVIQSLIFGGLIGDI
jgi:hypothetical protein